MAEQILTPEARARLAALAERATQGPWSLWSDESGGPIIRSESVRGQDHPEALVCYPFGEILDADAEYIAAANPAVVLALLRRVGELEELLMSLFDGTWGDPRDWVLIGYATPEIKERLAALLAMGDGAEG